MAKSGGKRASRRRKIKRPNPQAIATAKHSHTDAGPDRIVCLLCGETYKAITFTHLVRIHDFDPEHPIQEYKEMFGLDVAVPEEQRDLLRTTARQRHRRSGNRLWTQASVVRAIRVRRRRDQPLCYSAVPISLSEGARRVFGTWDDALRAAGEDPRHHRLTGAWPPDRVTAEILRMAESGRVSMTRALAENPTMYGVAVREHGSWGGALLAAGLDPAEQGETRARREASGIRKRLDWTPAAVVEAIRARARAGLPLNIASVKRDEGQALTHQARNRFGSWDAALKAAGVDPETVRLQRTWTRELVIEGIRVRERAGKSLLRKEAFAEDPPLVKAASRLFPNRWDDAVAAACQASAPPRGSGGASRRRRRSRHK